jgi:hypothetical protein
MKASRARHRAIIKSRQRPSAAGETVHFPMPALRCGAVLAAPADVPVSVAALFGWLSRRLSPRAAYNVASSSIGWHGASASHMDPRPRRAARFAHAGLATISGRDAVAAVGRWRSRHRAATESEEDRFDGCPGDGSGRECSTEQVRSCCGAACSSKRSLITRCADCSGRLSDSPSGISHHRCANERQEPFVGSRTG